LKIIVKMKGGPLMKQKTSLELTHELIQLMRQLPRLKLKKTTIAGLKQSEQGLLVILAINLGNDKKLFTVTEISNLLQITPAGVTHLINPLEELGFIERLQAPNDRRVVLIGLTDKGTKFSETLIAKAQEELIGLVNHLGEEDSKTAIRLMSKAIEFFASQVEN
jgi:DNA-binding MarR family transcriptional regulator